MVPNSPSQATPGPPDPRPAPGGHTPKQVVTNILTHQGRLLLLKRSQMVGSFRGQWAGCSGYVEPGDGVQETSLKEIEEETGMRPAALRLLARGEPLLVEKPHGSWLVHPFLYGTDSPRVTLDWEHDAYEWVEPERVGDFDIVPGLKSLIRDLLERAAGPGSRH